MARIQHIKSEKILTVPQASVDIIMGNPLISGSYRVLPEAEVPEEVKELIAEKESSGTSISEPEPQTTNKPPRKRKPRVPKV